MKETVGTRLFLGRPEEAPRMHPIIITSVLLGGGLIPSYGSPRGTIKILNIGSRFCYDIHDVASTDTSICDSGCPFSHDNNPYARHQHDAN